MEVKRQYTEGEYTITEYDNGAVIKTLTSAPSETPPPNEPQPPTTPQPTMADKINYLYYKSMGVI